MGRVEDNFLDRKLEHIIRDYQAGWSMGQKRSDRINSIRTWNVTVGAAYLAYVATRDSGVTGATLLPLAGVIFLFWIMEAFTGSLGRFNMELVIGKVDELFWKPMPSGFEQAIREHKFLSQQNQEKKRWGKHGQWDRFTRAFLNDQTKVFYLLPLVILFVLLMLQHVFSAFYLYVPISMFVGLMALLKRKLDFCERARNRVWRTVRWPSAKPEGTESKL